MTKTEILDAINLLLVEKWPNRTVYVDVCPVDFDRPSFWLAVEKHDLIDANRFLIKNDLQLFCGQSIGPAALYGKFQTSAQVKAISYCIQERCHLGRRKGGGRATADVNAAHRFS